MTEGHDAVKRYAGPLGIFAEGVRDWAEVRADIRMILIVGSMARQDHPADEFADLDLVIFTTDLATYRDPDRWLRPIGRSLVCSPFERRDGCLEFLALFEGGHEVDFSFSPLEQLDRLAPDGVLPEVYDRGYDVLLDKDGLSKRLPRPSYGPVWKLKPPAEAFERTVSGFWHEADYCARCIRRRDLWGAKLSDGELKGKLLTMMEWHAGSRHGWQCDTWAYSRYLGEWTDDRTWAALSDVYGKFDAGDSWRALLATMELFSRLAGEVAAREGYGDGAALETAITEYVHGIHAADKA